MDHQKRFLEEEEVLLLNIMPASTGAAKAVTKVIPSLAKVKLLEWHLEFQLLMFLLLI